MAVAPATLLRKAAVAAGLQVAGTAACNTSPATPAGLQMCQPGAAGLPAAAMQAGRGTDRPPHGFKVRVRVRQGQQLPEQSVQVDAASQGTGRVMYGVAMPPAAGVTHTAAGIGGSTPAVAEGAPQPLANQPQQPAGGLTSASVGAVATEHPAMQPGAAQSAAMAVGLSAELGAAPHGLQYRYAGCFR